MIYFFDGFWFGYFLSYDTILPMKRMQHSLITMLICIFCLTQLSGCGVVHNQGVKHDGPPAVDNIKVSKLKDAVPRVEPLHPYGTRDYVLGGRYYRVLKSAKGYVKRGYASWYGSKFHGRETSTQERYNLYAMTAASPELPLPSYVQVTNLRNGKKIIVRVNDRGPFNADPNRILDLSYAAAKKLDFVNSGVIPVKIMAIDPTKWGAESRTDSKKFAQTKSIDQKQIFLQIGAFAKLDNAKQLSNKVNAIISKPIRIEHKHDLYRVHIGPLASSHQCDQIKSFLKQNGFDHVTVIGG
ncbi:MAG: septal ring lytic transglycosylase RlpA family protein [Coxiellaceae bacterium]|jgi:rare lipoprotein A|nr:septal ring lytic transglycosylase RlpA family protein [Coxiellaceae bacterium]